ncbi:DUF2993 domain-containing protein [Streptantibioticus rubrisoli]|uniref:DUF2993 domain-containing protein n=1 Tax=Streptantibioticus rubrisoli TaxID=1387313 RepID=A0ABT1PAV3_9ACTN|nr:DUF2993 domain-containing protein [Streptantibioticus rubrisoli]MCQ4041568.1 DUF2993 domain-containing protein [Streptantibioticus rubrisoli]
MAPHTTNTTTVGHVSGDSHPHLGESDWRNPYEELADPRGAEPAPPRHNPYEELGWLDLREEDRGDPLGLGLRPEYDDQERVRRGGHRRHRPRRGLRVPTTAKALAAVLTCGAFLTLADRWAALYAEKQAAHRLKEAMHLQADPEVDIHGFPFLTQVAYGRLDQVDITVPHVSAGPVSMAKVDGSVREIRILGDVPSSIRGAVIGRMQGSVLLAFDDLDRELGSSQVKFSAKDDQSVLAEGRLAIAGYRVRARAVAHLRLEGDRSVNTTIDDMLIDVPGVASYTPGDNGGLRLARPMAERIRTDAAKAKALLAVGAIAQRLGLTPQIVREAARSDAALRRITGDPRFVERLMRVNILDLVEQNPWLLGKIGVDPSLVQGLRDIQMPKLAERLSLSFRLPELPGGVRLRDVSVRHDGIEVHAYGSNVPVGGGTKL